MSTTPPPTPTVAPRRALSVLTLFSVGYAAVVCGPYGLEQSIGQGGPALTVLLLAVTPFLWSLPGSLCVAELACALPLNGGPVRWVSHAFSPRVATVLLLDFFLLNIVDFAIFPTIFSDYFAPWFGGSAWAPALLKVSFIWACAALNIAGISVVGVAAVALSAITTAPFVAMVGVQLLDAPRFVDWRLVFGRSAWPEIQDASHPAPQHHQLHRHQSAHALGHRHGHGGGGDGGGVAVTWSVLLGAFVPVVAWNYSGFETLGTMAGEVARPRRTFPVALLLLVVAAAATYTLPVLVGVTATGRLLPYSAWRDGFWTTVGNVIGGDELAFLVAVGAVAATVGAAITAATATSRSLAAMGEVGYFFPSARFSKWIAAYHPDTHTPVRAIAVNAACVSVVCCSSSFQPLVELDQVLYAVRLGAILAAFLRLRHTEPDLPRPFRVPGGAAGAYVCGVLPLLYTLAVAALTMIGSPWLLRASLALAACLVAGGWLLSRDVDSGRLVAAVAEAQVSDEEDEWEKAA